MQYLMHAFEAGVRGICIVACPEGRCKLSQGNYRARMRIATVRRLLTEVGIDPKNARLVQCEGGETADRIQELVNETVTGFFSPSAAVSSYV